MLSSATQRQPEAMQTAFKCQAVDFEEQERPPDRQLADLIRSFLFKETSEMCARISTIRAQNVQLQTAAADARKRCTH